MSSRLLALGRRLRAHGCKAGTAAASRDSPPLAGLLLMLLGALLAQRGLAADAPSTSTVPGGVGTIVGIVRDANHQPLAGATVTAVRDDGSATRATISGADGLFMLPDLPPGNWSLSLQADGYLEAAVSSLLVQARRATRHDIVMNVAAAPGAPASQVSASTAAAPGSGTAAPAAGAPPTSVPPTAPSAPSAPPAPAAAVASASESQQIPKALMAPPPSTGVDNFTPFAFGDFTWLNGSPRNHAPAFDTQFFTPDIRFDAYYVNDFNHPVDHTIDGSTEEFRSGEVQLEQVSFGGDFHWDNVRARVLTMYGLFATTIPRNDASSGEIGGVGQWDLQDAYRYISEANAGYHFDVSHGLNIDAGIFASYIGLFSFYNYDNWTYQPSYVSSNTPWVFNGLRIQWFPTNTLKIEPWIINGWASYAKFNSHPGVGGQILWMPNENFKLVLNNYGIGQDNLANTPNNPLAKATRIHTDDSIEVKYYQSSANGMGVSKAAFSLTADAGCQYGGTLHCTGGPNKSAFLGWMLYDRYWFDHDLFAVTFGGGSMTNPGRYLTLLPPIDGATASTGTPYFTENPGQHLYQWDSTINFQYMRKEWITWWTELGFRHSDVPYFAGPGGVTPPGGNNGAPQDYACNSGASAGTSNLQQAYTNCGPEGVWFPDLVKREAMWSFGVLVKF